MFGWKRPSPALVALVVAGIVIAASWYGDTTYDFQAFYCAGGALDAGIDPYRFGYIAHCEGTLAAIPAPLPGYDLALFGLLARLPFEAANAVYLAASTAAVALSAVALVRLTRLSATVVAAALFVSEFFLSIHSGQIISFAVAAVALAAWLAESSWPSWAGVAVLGALIEPHVGLGACLATAVALPAARRPMAAGVAALAVLSLGTMGWPLTLEYFRDVLPRHAVSEITYAGQLSLTHVLHLAGAGDRLALAAGSLSFALTLVAGVVLGTRLSRRYGAAFAVTVPPALALIGGTFIHGNQMCLALPAALLAYSRFPRWRAYVAVAICLLAVPWVEPKVVAGEVPSATLAIAVLAYAFTRGHRLATALAAGATAIALPLFNLLTGTERAGLEAAFRPTVAFSGFADDEWRQLVAVKYSDHLAPYALLASLTWLALGLLAFVLARSAGRTQPE